MGARLFPADLMTVARQVMEDLASLGYTLTGTQAAGEREIVEGLATRADVFSTTCRWRAEQVTKGTLLSLEIRPHGRAHRRAVRLLAVQLALAVSIVLQVLVLGAKVVGSEFFLLTISLAGIGFLYAFFAYERRARLLVRKEIEIWNRLEQEQRSRKVLPVTPSLLGKATESLLLVSAMFLVGVSFVKLVPVMVVPVSLLLVVAVPSAAVYGLLRTNAFAQWRLCVLGFARSLAHLSLWPVLFLNVAYVGYVALSLYATGAAESASELVAAAASSWNYATKYTRAGLDTRGVVREIAQKYVERHVAEPSTSTSGSAEILRQKAAARLMHCRLIIVLGYLFILTGDLIMLATAPWDWRRGTGEQGPILPFRVPPVKAEKGTKALWPQLLISFFLAGCGLLNLVGLALSVEAVHYAVTGKCFIPQLTFALAWMDLPYYELGGAGASCFADRYLGASIVFAFAAPPLFVPAFKFLKLAVGGLRKVRELFRLHGGQRTPPAEVEDTVTRISSKAEVPAPVVRLVPDAAVALSIRKRLWERRARLDVTTGAIRQLSYEELEAAIAHEVSHMRQGLLGIEVARVLSWLFFFPNGCWHALFDFVERELDADMRAVGLTGNREALVSAIVKTSISPTYLRLHEDHAERGMAPFSWYRRAVQAYRSFSEFLSGDVMVGYAHPHLTDRIEAIRGT